MEKLVKIVDASLSALAAIALVAMMLHTVAHALMRSVFGAPLYGTNELVSYWYLPVVTLLGFVAAQLRKEHISVSLVFDRLKERNQLEYTVISRVLGIALFLGLAWFGLTEAIGDIQTGLTAGVTTIVVWPVKLLVPIAFVLLGALYLLDIIQRVKSLRPSEGLAAVSSYEPNDRVLLDASSVKRDKRPL